MVLSCTGWNTEHIRIVEDDQQLREDLGLSEKKDYATPVKLFGLFLLRSLWGGIKMVGGTLLVISAIFVVLGVFLGIPALAITMFEQGNYVWGWVCVLISLIAYGVAFNQDSF